MKSPFPRTSGARGFSLMELMVAMAITSIIVVTLVSITSMGIETWNRSRAELRASRQAKAMIEVMAKDFEALVLRKGNTNEWLSAKVESTLPGDKFQSTNAAQVVFFTAATDRYDGNIGVANKDLGGDVSTVGYELNFRDAIDASSTTSKSKNYIFNRYIVNPDQTFKNLLGKTTITLDPVKTEAKTPTPPAAARDEESFFVCENIHQFSLTFNVQVSKAGTGGVTTVYNVPIILASTDGASEFHIKGNEITTTGSVSYPSGVNADDVKAGRLASVEVSLTVLSDNLVNASNNRNPSDREKLQNTFQYSKLIQVPSP